MSIISEALKKAGDQNSPGRSGIYQSYFKKRAPFSFLRVGLTVMVMVFFVGFAGSAYYVYKIKGQSTSEWPQTFSFARSTPETGLGRFAVEERALHEIGSFSAQPGDPLFILSGIARNEDGFLAVINDQILREGDQIEGARIVGITLNYVELELNNERIFLEKGY